MPAERSSWHSVGESTSAYVAEYRKRCLAALRAIRFGYWLLLVDWIIAAPWLTWDFLKPAPPERFGAAAYFVAMGILVSLTVVFLTVFYRTRRRALQELAMVDEFEGGPMLGRLRTES